MKSERKKIPSWGIILKLTLILSYYLSFAEDNINTSPLNSVLIFQHEGTLIEHTKTRINQLKGTSFFGNLSPLNSPNIDFSKYLIPLHEKFKTPLSTEVPEFRTRFYLNPENNEAVKFEDIFSTTLPELRVNICRKLLSLDNKSIAEKIIHYLAYGTPSEALVIDEILPSLKSDVEKILIDLFQDKTLPIQKKRAVAYALGRIKSTESAGYLWNEAHTTSNYEMRYTCLQSLANMPHSLSLEQWVEFLQSDSPNISLIACKAIFDYGGIDAERYIRKILLGEIKTHKNVKEYALSRVANYPLSVLIPLFIEIMEKNPEISLDSANILKARTGMNFGPSPQLWKKWWEDITSQSMQNSNNPPIEPFPQIPEGTIHPPKIKKR